MRATLYYVHDPMCSWCWAYRPVWDVVKVGLSESVALENVAGGLARDTDEPMPQQLQQTIQGYWREIQALLGTEFNFDFWSKNQPRRSTYIACRAVIAAKNQGAEEQMIDAIQRAYYLRAMNPSNPEVLVGLAGEQGMDAEQFAADLVSAGTEAEFKRQMALARQLPIEGFPSLVLQQGTAQTLITRNYTDAAVVLAEIQQLVNC